MMTKIMMMRKTKNLKIILVVLAIVIANMSLIPKAFAGTLTYTSTLELGSITGTYAAPTAAAVNPMIASDAQEVAIDFTYGGTTGAPGTITVNFAPTGGTNFTTNGGTLGATGSQTASSTNCAALFPSTTPAAIALPGTLAATASGTTISVTGATSITSASNYCFVLTFNGAITNPSAGNYIDTITVNGYSQTDGYPVLSSTSNSYSVTTTVGPQFTLSLSGTSDTLGNLSFSTPTTSTGITATVGTNAATGWDLWAEDLNNPSGLHSTSASTTIPMVTNASSVNMTTDAGGAHNAIGVGTYGTTPYADAGGTAKTGAGLAYNTYNEIATSGSATAQTTAVIYEIADISAVTPPATDYTDTITVIGAGSF
jgi:hypothetical protein